MNERIENLRLLIERQEKCRAQHLVSTPIHEQFEGMPVWDGVVETFQLDGHSKTKRAYGWVVPATKREEEAQYIFVLGVPPIKSAQDAVKASISKESKDLIRLGRKIKFGE